MNEFVKPKMPVKWTWTEADCTKWHTWLMNNLTGSQKIYTDLKKNPS